MKVALLQINPIVGDLEGNAVKIEKFAKIAKGQGAELAVTSELALLGYPPRDLLLYPSFITKAAEIIQNFAIAKKWKIPILVGTVAVNKSKIGKPLYNTAAFINKDKVEKLFYKLLLPTYDVFDEDRYFEPAAKAQFLNFNGSKIGISICEDLWNDRDFWNRPRYHFDPIEELTKQKVDLIINLSASPFTVEKQILREKMIASSAKKYKVPIIYVNQVGGNDDLIFDGASTVFDAKGQLIARAKAFEEDLLVVDIDNLGSDPQVELASEKPKRNTIKGRTLNKYPVGSEAVFKALKLGLRDYVKKCGFERVLVGLSGGIDSAVTTAIATEALGHQNVTAILMPSPHTANSSIIDAQKLAKNLGVKTLTITIKNLMASFDNTLKLPFKGYRRDVTEQNIQARIRGNLLMALSNKYNALVLSTGNKSELTVGYTTIYGDMTGGLAVIGDVLKTQVYKLARWINQQKQLIPQSILSKVPSAELAPGQKDQDTLPPYEVLDKIIHYFVEKHFSKEEIISTGLKKEAVEKVVKMIRQAEYKRRQAPPTLKISERAFGVGWRMPIAASNKS